MKKHSRADFASESAIINALAFYAEFHNNNNMHHSRKKIYRDYFAADNEEINYPQLLREIYKKHSIN